MLRGNLIKEREGEDQYDGRHRIPGERREPVELLDFRIERIDELDELLTEDVKDDEDDRTDTAGKDGQHPDHAAPKVVPCLGLPVRKDGQFDEPGRPVRGRPESEDRTHRQQAAVQSAAHVVDDREHLPHARARDERLDLFDQQRLLYLKPRHDGEEDEKCREDGEKPKERERRAVIVDVMVFKAMPDIDGESGQSVEHAGHLSFLILCHKQKHPIPLNRVPSVTVPSIHRGSPSRLRVRPRPDASNRCRRFPYRRYLRGGGRPGL